MNESESNNMTNNENVSRIYFTGVMNHIGNTLALLSLIFPFSYITLGVFGVIPLLNSIYTSIITAVIGGIVFFSSPRSIKTDKYSFTMQYIFGVKLKYNWEDIKIYYELNFMFPFLLIFTYNMVFIVVSDFFDTKEYDNIRYEVKFNSSVKE